MPLIISISASAAAIFSADEGWGRLPNMKDMMKAALEVYVGYSRWSLRQCAGTSSSLCSLCLESLYGAPFVHLRTSRLQNTLTPEIRRNTRPHFSPTISAYIYVSLAFPLRNKFCPKLCVKRRLARTVANDTCLACGWSNHCPMSDRAQYLCYSFSFGI